MADQAGLRSDFMPWLAGVDGSTAPVTQAGLRSMLLPWFGGIASSSQQAGLRSTFMPWLGGVSCFTLPPWSPSELYGGVVCEGALAVFVFLQAQIDTEICVS